MDLEYIKILSTVILAIVGWGVSNRLNLKHSRDDKRRELVTNHLIQAYRILTQEIGRRESSKSSMTKLENLLSEIQLFGSPTQVEIARNIASETANKGVSEIDPLIENMRDSLRLELGLDKIDGNTIWLRFTDEFKRQIDDKIT